MGEHPAFLAGESMIAALLLSVALVPPSCAAQERKLDKVVQQVKGMPAYAGARNAAIFVMPTREFLDEMSLYHGRRAQRVLAFADPPAFVAYIRIDYLCVATERELLQTVMHEFRHLIRPEESEEQVQDAIDQNWPGRFGPPTADPMPRIENWRAKHGR